VCKNPSCKVKNSDVNVDSEIKSLPQILITYIDNEITTLQYYINVHFFHRPYTMISFISKTDENNDVDNSYNLFFLKNGRWYIYNFNKSEEKETTKILEVKSHPVIIFYKLDQKHIDKLPNIILNNYLIYYFKKLFIIKLF
jgi:hypothetical protein